MQVTKELVEKDIESIRVQLEQAKAQVGQLAGALTTLTGVLEYLNKPEPEKKEEEPTSSEVVDKPTSEVLTAQVVDARGKYHDKAEQENV